MNKKNKKDLKIEKLEIRRNLNFMDIPKHVQEAKGKVGQTGMLVARDMVLGGFVGGMVGSGLGRWSLLGGGLAAGLSYYFGIPGLAGFGIGMAAAGLNQKEETTPPPVDGVDMKTRIAEAQERMKAFAEGFKKKLWLDKIGTKKEDEKKETEKQVTEDTTTQTVGALGEGDDPLAEIEQQLIAEAVNFQRENGVQTAADFAGTGSLFDDDEEDEDDMFLPQGPAISTVSRTMEFRPETNGGGMFSAEEMEPEIDFDTI